MEKPESSEAQKGGLFTQLGRPESAPPWNLLEVSNSVFVLLICVIVIGPTLGALFFAGQVVTVSVLFGWMAGGVLATSFIYLSNRQSREKVAAFNLVDTGAASYLFLLLIGIGISVTLNLIAGLGSGTFLPAAELVNLRDAGLFAWLLAAVLVMGVMPVSEALIFRVMLLSRLRASLGPWPGILLYAAIYGLFHFLVYTPTTEGAIAIWYGLIWPTAVGFLLAIVQIRARSTRISILVHSGMGIFNFLAALVLLG